MVSHFVQVIVVHTICNWIRISYFAALLATNLIHQFCLPKLRSLVLHYVFASFNPVSIQASPLDGVLGHWLAMLGSVESAKVPPIYTPQAFHASFTLYRSIDGPYNMSVDPSFLFLQYFLSNRFYPYFVPQLTPNFVVCAYLEFAIIYFQFICIAMCLCQC